MSKSKIFKKIFWITSDEVIGKLNSNFVMCGTKNWNYYFSKIENVKKKDYEELKNVELVKFESKKEMFNFWEKLSDCKKIDWSLEHGVPTILKSI